MEEWQEKLHRSAGPLALGYREEVGIISETRQWPVAHRHLNAPPPEQLRFGLGQPEGHLQGAIQGNGDLAFGTGLFPVSGLRIKGAEAPYTAGSPACHGREPGHPVYVPFRGTLAASIPPSSLTRIRLERHIVCSQGMTPPRLHHTLAVKAFSGARQTALPPRHAPHRCARSWRARPRPGAHWGCRRR
jgi:hypothetical protein